MSMRATFLCAGALAATLSAAVGLGSASARATTMPERSPAEVAQASALVVEATVLSEEVRRVGGRLVTVRELQVHEVLRSSEGAAAPARVSLVLPGGELEGIGQRVAGTPRLKEGARYVLCLSAPVLGAARTVVGLWQGVWRVDGQGALLPFTHHGEAALAMPRAVLLPALQGQP